MGCSHGKEMKLAPCLILLMKMNSKWMKDLYVRPEIIELLDENTGIKFLNMGLGNDCLGGSDILKSNKIKSKQLTTPNSKASAQ